MSGDPAPLTPEQIEALIEYFVGAVEKGHEMFVARVRAELTVALAELENQHDK